MTDCMMVLVDGPELRRIVDQRFDIGIQLSWNPEFGGGVEMYTAGVKELADLAEVSDATVYRAMKGKRLNYFTLDRIATALSVNADRLVVGEPPEVSDAQVARGERRQYHREWTRRQRGNAA